MDEAISYVFKLHGEATDLCERLKAAMEREREFLVAFKMDEIPQVTLEKESLISILTRKRMDLKEYLRLRYGVEKVSLFAERLSGEEQESWRQKEQRWQEIWAETRDCTRRNDAFLKNSLRNLGVLAENLKRCLGEQSIYNAKGSRVEFPNEGKVVEGRY